MAARIGSICDTSANLFVSPNGCLTKNCFRWKTVSKNHTRTCRVLFRKPWDTGKGMKACIIDFDNLRLKTPHMVDDLPGGGSRFESRRAGGNFCVR